MSTTAIHDRLLNLTQGTRLAIGVSWDWLKTAYIPLRLNEINNARVKPVQLPVPELAAMLRVDLARTTLRLRPDFKPLLDLRLILDLRAAQQPDLSFREWTLDYSGIEIALLADPFLAGEVRFDATSVPQPAINPVQPQPNQQAIDLPSGYNGDAQRYGLDERAVTLFGWKSLAQEIAAQLPFPPLIGSLRSFRFGSDLEFFYDSDYCIVASQNIATESAGCPCSEDALAELSVVTESVDVAASRDSDSRRKIAVPVSVSHKAKRLVCSPTLKKFPKLVALYPREKTFLQWSSGDLSPGIGIEDSGIALLVRWFYFVTALLKNITLSFSASGITIETTWFVGGSAGANLKIGCVEFGIASVSTFVDPLGPVVVDASLCTEDQRLFLTTSLRSSGNTRIVFTGLGYPLDIVVNWVTQSIGRKVLARVLAKAINSLRISLVDFKEAPDWLRFSTYSLDTKPDSMLIGLDLGVGARADTGRQHDD